VMQRYEKVGGEICKKAPSETRPFSSNQSNKRQSYLIGF